jgi:hypothetical protein
MKNAHRILRRNCKRKRSLGKPRLGYGKTVKVGQINGIRGYSLV